MLAVQPSAQAELARFDRHNMVKGRQVLGSKACNLVLRNTAHVRWERLVGAISPLAMRRLRAFSRLLVRI
jgi:hypothetical protein